MKVTQKQMQFIKNVVDTARLLGIDNIIIEPGCVRGIDEAGTVVILQLEDMPDSPDFSIGLSRTETFLGRYNIAIERDKFTVEATIDDDEFVRSFKMKGAGMSSEFRCANPANLKAPKKVNDEFIYRFQLNDDCVSLLQKGLAAMKSETVTINSKDDVNFILTDVNSDEFKIKVTDDVAVLDDDVDNVLFAYQYPAKLLLDLFRKNSVGEVDIGRKGILLFPINGLDVYVLPKV